jgi:SAM-dependent methyltransferase
MYKKIHLDLGSGRFPRNPFGADFLYGIDIISSSITEQSIEVRKADLNFEKIPFEDNFFDSVSAFDFFEHILRVHVEGKKTTFPFMDLMGEIHRVLKPGGRLFALTPAYPKASAFVDPTHVNFITKNTHKYFCAPDLWAKMYGYNAAFSVNEVRFVNFSTAIKVLKNEKKILSELIDNIYPRRKQHLVWDLKKINVF